MSGIKQGLYHFGLSLHTPNHHYDSLVFRKLWQEQLIILLSKLHPLKSLQVIKFDDQRTYSIILFLSNTLFYELNRKPSFTPREILFVKSYNVLQILVMAHFEVSLVTESMLKNMQNEHIIARAFNSDFSVDTYLIYRTDKNSCQHYKEFRKYS